MLNKFRFNPSFFLSFSPQFPATLSILAALFIFIIYFFVYPGSPILYGHCPDPDDYLYLAQGLDWIKGQGWYDLFMPRENPPQGTYIHYSRFLSSFYGLISWAIAHAAHIQLTDAAIIGAAFIPVVFFALFLIALKGLTESFSKETALIFVPFLAILAPAILDNFEPGHVDHHGLELAVAVASVACVMRMMENPGFLKWPLLSALFLVIGLVIGLEFLPIFFMVSAYVGLWFMYRPSIPSRTGAIFGYSLFLANTLFLILTKPLTAFFALDILNYSFVYVLVTAGMALCFITVDMTERYAFSRLGRILSGVAAFAVVSALFLYTFPSFKKGPLGGLDPIIEDFTKEYIGEALPLVGVDQIGSIDFLGVSKKLLCLAAPLLALMGCLSCFIKNIKPGRWQWGMMILLLVLSILLAAFYQVRFMGYTQALSLVPLAYILELVFRRLKSCCGERRLFPFSLTLLQLGCLLIILALPFMQLSEKSQDLLQEQDAISDCNIENLLGILNDPRLYGDRPRLIMNDVDLGPELLFRTFHKVIAVSDFSNTEGIADFMKFYNLESSEEAKDIVRRRHIDLLVVCDSSRPYSRPVMENGHFATGPNGKRRTLFIQRLINGQIPDWIKPVDVPALKKNHVLLFEIKNSELGN